MIVVELLLKRDSEYGYVYLDELFIDDKHMLRLCVCVDGDDGYTKVYPLRDVTLFDIWMHTVNMIG